MVDDKWIRLEELKRSIARERERKRDKKVYAVFVNLKTAFNNVDREKL